MKLWTTPNSWVGKQAAARAAELDFDSVKNIAVIKHGALGDMVLTRPMFTTLRNYFPNAKLTVSVVSNYMRGIPEDLVDRVHVAIGNDRKTSVGEIKKSYKSLGYQDILFDISATTRSFWISRLNPAGLKIGFIHRLWHRYLYDVAIPRSHYRFEAETFLEQLHVLGMDFVTPLDFSFPSLPPVVAAPYIVYFPTASAEYKCWPVDRYADLIARATNTLGEFTHILLGGIAQWEMEKCDIIRDRIGLRPNFQFMQGGEKTNALITNAHLVVSNDTGIRNLAIATDTPTVGTLLFPTTTFGYEPRYGIHKCIYHPDGTAPTVDEVFAAMCSALNQIPFVNEVT
ncbi:glycosyltransferase family 9 protein [Sulfurivermis fontis]|uniref:glycosyltransferase family 9 protein n=1 Tax=Sulfurivermis fontis TaxID=1972068 RepID=UPI000FDB1C7D|nr:glycosyltransferase family 9 protein [Sulfurivermis fontis]